MSDKSVIRTMKMGDKYFTHSEIDKLLSKIKSLEESNLMLLKSQSEVVEVETKKALTEQRKEIIDIVASKMDYAVDDSYTRGVNKGIDIAVRLIVDFRGN